MAITKTDVYDVQAPFALDLRLVKADMNARNAIGTFQRYFGMVVYTLSDGKFWLWPQGAVDNDDWVDLFGNSDATIQSVVVNPGAPAGGSNGDIWLRQQGNVVSVYQNVEPAGWTALGDLVIGSALQSVTVSASSPTGGNPGDIHFKNIEEATEVWQNNDGTWGVVGTIPTGGDTGDFVLKTGDTMTGPLQFMAGTSTVAPIKIPAGTLVTVPQAGAVESDGDGLYFTDSVGTRHRLAVVSSDVFVYTPAGNFAVSDIQTLVEAAGKAFNDSHIIIELGANNFEFEIDLGVKNFIFTAEKRGSGSISFTSTRTLNAGVDNITIMNGNEGSMALVQTGTTVDFLTIRNK